MLKSKNPNFPELCDGVTVDYDDNRGRFIRALRDLPVGTVVCVEEGVTVNISNENCYRCLSDLKGKTEIYCQNCEKFNEPEELAKGEFDDLGLFKLAAHIVISYPIQQIMQIMRSAEPVIPNEAPSNLSTSDFDSIMQLRPMPQIGDAFQDSHIKKSVSKMVKLLSKHSEWGQLDDETRWIVFSKALRLVAERSAKNSHVIYSIEQTCRASQEEPIGTGMFPISSIFNHSCTPNVFAFFDRNRFIFVSRGVKAGEELVDSYGVTYQQNTFEKRKEFLASNSGFECICQKCSTKASLDQFLISGMNDPQRLVSSVSSILDIDQYIEYAEPGNKDIEVLITHFTAKDDAKDHPEKVLQLWEKFVSNANLRGITFDDHLVRPYLEQLVCLTSAGSSTPLLPKYQAKYENSLFSVYQLLHTLFSNLHPASSLIAELIRVNVSQSDSSQSLKELHSRLEVLVRKMWPM